MSGEPNLTHLAYGTKDEEWGIYCTSLESFDEVPPENLNRLNGPEGSGRVLDDYLFFYLTAGRGLLRREDGEDALEPGVLVMAAPKIRHWLLPFPGAPWSVRAVSFKGKNVDAFMASKFFAPTAAAHPIGLREPVIAAFDRLKDVAAAEQPCFQQLLGALVLEIFAYALSYDVAGLHDQRELDVLEQAKGVLAENLYKRVDMEQVAEGLGMGYKPFCDLFRSYTGQTPYQYFLNMKMNRAKELLSEGRMSVKEVSYKLAFQTPYYFSRFFKIKTGMPPSKWNGLDLEDL